MKKKKYAEYTRLTRKEKDIIEHSKFIYAVFVSPHPLAEMFNEDEMLQAVQILIRPIGLSSKLSH